MDFELSDEQRAFGHSVSRFLQERYSFEHRRRSLRAQADDTTWQALAALGIPMLLVPASAGGVAGRASDVLSVCEAFGGALVLQPLLSSCVMATVALASDASAPLVHPWLEHMVTGEARMGWAHDEGRPGGAPATQARPSSAGAWRLDGGKADVLYGMSADAFVVSASEDDDTGRTGLFLVDAAQSGLRRSAHTLVDGTPAADLTLQACPAIRLGVDAIEVIERVALWGAFASCAERVGVMDAALQQARRHITQASLITGSAAQRVCEAAVQLHGGIGMTEEHPVGSMLRRVVCLNHLFGNGRALARELAAA